MLSDRVGRLLEGHSNYESAPDFWVPDDAQTIRSGPLIGTSPRAASWHADQTITLLLPEAVAVDRP